jgi:hypothetical protein
MAFLVISEIVAYTYGHHEKELISAPCYLSDSQKTKLSNFLADSSRDKLTIKANISAEDARAYSDVISQFLNSLGWDTHIDNAIITGSNIKRIWLTIKDRNHVPNTAVILHQAFVNAGIAIRESLDVDLSGPNQNEIWLLIG